MGDKRYEQIRELAGCLEEFQLSNPDHSFGRLLRELSLMKPPMSIYEMSDQEFLRRLGRAFREAEKYGPLGGGTAR